MDERLISMVKHQLPRAFRTKELKLDGYGYVDNDSFIRFSVLDCEKFSIFNTKSNCTSLSTLTDFDLTKQSLLRLNTENVLYICFDTEFFYNDNQRNILSYQITAKFKDKIKSYIFFPRYFDSKNLDNKKTYLLNLYEIVEYCYKQLGLDEFIYSYYDFNKSKSEFDSKYKDSDGKLLNGISDSAYKKAFSKFKKDFLSKYKLKVYFVSHYFNADIKTLGDFNKFGGHISEGSNGSLVSMPGDSYYLDKCYRWDKVNKKVVYSVEFRDTIALVNSSLAELGKSLNLPKLSTDEHYESKIDIKHMDKTLINETEAFINYGCRDTEILMSYLIKNWSNCRIPISITNFAVTVFKNYGFDNDSQKVLEFRGLKKVTNDVFDDFGYRGISEKLVPVSHIATEVANLSQLCYMGGLNQSLYQGYIDEVTYDYDLKGAYPTVGCILPDVDYECDSYLKEWNNQDFTIYDTQDLNYNAMGVGVVDFEFPENTYQPCIAQHTEHGLVYTLEGKNVYTDWASVRLAILLGAKVKAKRFVVLRNKKDEFGQVKTSLFKGFKTLLQVRDEQKNTYGKGSVQELTSKLTNNSVYGKIGQGVTDKSRRNIKNGEMEDMQESPLTSGIHATYFTSIPRLIMCSAINQLKTMGYQVYTCTTDGFISNAPLEIIENLDLYGLADLYRFGRQISCNDNKIWEIKHTQKYLINITTRMNQGFDDENGKPIKGVNVCANVGYKEPIESDSFFLKEYLKRDKYGIININTHLTSINEQFLKGLDFISTTTKTSLKCNYDFKRNIDTNTFETKKIHLTYGDFTIENYDSLPYLNIQEYENTRLKLSDLTTTLLCKDDIIDFLDKDKLSKSLNKTLIYAPILFYINEEYKTIYKEFVTTFSRELFIDLVNETLKEYNVKGNYDLTKWKNLSRPSRQKGKIFTDESHEVVNKICEKMDKQLCNNLVLNN